MRSMTPIYGLLRAAALVVLVVALAACGRNGTGVGNLGPGGGPPGSQQEFLVTVGDRVFFETDSSSLTPTATATLDKQATWLNHYTNYKILIEGHADERGTREYNIALGERRASAVKSYLQGLGVQPNRMLTISYGSERPVDPGHDEQAWAQNRRAVTVVNVTQ